MILLVIDSAGAIHQTLDCDPLTARYYLQPGQSLAAGCVVPQLDNDRLYVADGVVTRIPTPVPLKPMLDLFDWDEDGPDAILPGEGQVVEVIYTRPDNYEEDPNATAEGAE